MNCNTFWSAVAEINKNYINYNWNFNSVGFHLALFSINNHWKCKIFFSEWQVPSGLPNSLFTTICLSPTNSNICTICTVFYGLLSHKMEVFVHFGGFYFLQYIMHVPYYIVNVPYYIVNVPYYIVHVPYYIMHVTYYIVHVPHYIVHVPHYIMQKANHFVQEVNFKMRDANTVYPNYLTFFISQGYVVTGWKIGTGTFWAVIYKMCNVAMPKEHYSLYNLSTIFTQLYFIRKDQFLLKIFFSKIWLNLT